MNDLINPHAWHGSFHSDLFVDELLPDDDTNASVDKGHAAPLSPNK